MERLEIAEQCGESCVDGRGRKRVEWTDCVANNFRVHRIRDKTGQTPLGKNVLQHCVRRGPRDTGMCSREPLHDTHRNKSSSDEVEQALVVTREVGIELSLKYYRKALVLRPRNIESYNEWLLGNHLDTRISLLPSRPKKYQVYEAKTNGTMKRIKGIIRSYSKAGGRIRT